MCTVRIRYNVWKCVAEYYIIVYPSYYIFRIIDVSVVYTYKQHISIFYGEHTGVLYTCTYTLLTLRRVKSNRKKLKQNVMLKVATPYQYRNTYSMILMNFF